MEEKVKRKEAQRKEKTNHHERKAASEKQRAHLPAFDSWNGRLVLGTGELKCG